MKLIRFAICWFLLGLAGPAVAETSHTAEELLRSSVVHGVALSPNGKRIALGIGNASGITDSIAILDAARLAEANLTKRIPLATANAERLVTHMHWTSNRYLLVDARYGYKEPSADHRRLSLIHSIDADTGTIRPFDALHIPVRVLSQPDADADYIFVSSGFMHPLLYRIDLATSAAAVIEEGDPVTLAWRIRNGRAVVKFNQGKHGEIANIYARLSDGDEWKYVNSLRFPEDRRNHLEVIAEAESPLEEYLRKTREGADVDGIHRRDLRTKEITATVAQVPGHDIWSAQFRGGRFISANYVDDRWQQRFGDQELQQYYGALQKYFGPDANITASLPDDGRTRWLLHVTSPRNSGEFHIYDVTRRHADLIAVERPWLDPERLAPMAARTVRTRDGASIQAYLTCPDGATQGPRPLVVMPPAGPWSQSHLRYNADAQAFAAQGWCTVEPNFRGTYGRGRAFQTAGFGQWTYRVATDIEDTVHSLVAAGIADRDRVAAVAGSLGATAVLASAINRPDMYRAVVARTPVVNAKALLDDKKRRHGKKSIAFEDWAKWIGELERQDSLAKQAPRIACPIFLIHSQAAVDIPVEQSQELEKSLAKAGHRPKVFYPTVRLPGDPGAAGAIVELRSTLEFLSPLLHGPPSSAAPTAMP